MNFFFSLDNEKNNRLSPALSQSWIEDNIHEIISYKDDDIYDETNKQINVQNPIITLKLNEEIEKARTFSDISSYETHFTPNKLKRPISPESAYKYGFEQDLESSGLNISNENFVQRNFVEEEPVIAYPSSPFKTDLSANKSYNTNLCGNIKYQRLNNDEFYTNPQFAITDTLQSYTGLYQSQASFSNFLKNIDDQFQQQQQYYKIQKDQNDQKIFKSSSTLFKQNKINQNFVAHSISSDNVSLLRSNNNFNSNYQSRRIKGICSPYSNKLNIQNNTNSSLKNDVSQDNYSIDSDSFDVDLQKNEFMTLHVKNLDYKISADEWKRILTENFKRHCREVISINVVTNPDKSLLGIVKLTNKDDVRLAISSLHHKKIGYKRLNVSLVPTPSSNSPKSKVVALLRSNDIQEMTLTKFMELFELKYNQSITLSELFKLRDVVHISYSKDGQGRLIKLTNKIKMQHNSFYKEIKDLLETPYCLLHSNKYETKDPNGSSTLNGGWLPNVIVSLRLFKPSVHKLLNDHGGQMPLQSFLDCYRACILNESPANNFASQNLKSYSSMINTHAYSYQLIIDNENGVPLEHLTTCAQDVIIIRNQGVHKQLQWENDKTKYNAPTKQSNNRTFLDGNRFMDSEVAFCEFDESIEDSQKKQNQFSHEVVELFKAIPRCIIPLSKFNNEYHKKYGRQCRVSDYGFTKLNDLLESIPSVLQILGSEFEKKLTLTHRVQVRRFSNDLTKILKSHPTKQMFADEYPAAYEKYFNKLFDIKDYGVCFLEDMLAELPDSTISRKEIDGRTFIQIPKIVQMEEEKLCTQKLTVDLIDMLRHKPRFSIQFNKFIPNFHHHFGRQLKLSNFGFTKLIELLEAIPSIVQVFTKDSLQFVQLTKGIMLDLICQNILKLIDDNSLKIQRSFLDFEKMYNYKYEKIYYEDFDCKTMNELFEILPFKKHFINVNIVYDNRLSSNDCEVTFTTDPINERETKKISKLILQKLMDGADEKVLSILLQKQSFKEEVSFEELLYLLLNNEMYQFNRINNRSKHSIYKFLFDYFKFHANSEKKFVLGISDLYIYAKQIRNLFIKANILDIPLQDLDMLYKQNYQVILQGTEHLENKTDGAKSILTQVNSIRFTPKALGFTDLNLLYNNGLNLIVIFKKHNDRRVYLNKEFWPISWTDLTNNSMTSPDSSLSFNITSSPFEMTTALSHPLSTHFN